ncbi:DmsC/YnfH family molybdoenzyme membrane anchor subunit [Acerihabitans sp. TG2]|uniref:dimethyl sulfoxide reductase anchor subunit family protein n=1 Tax=Acerihabitans sp. TG2 TaxID=3096008 RepID=UPI002B225F09|nr:DmsC/YnfH family molybdoenzyme membrane anchor subunit [Acerihabitans sp. TG2]MEA9392117.1 DmsC/YnfH family molybdoenzyme membrane anchor subunit [Acerihabitans sp. TG2]
MHELPLVFFTVFTQSAIGAFIVLLIAGLCRHINARRLATGLFGAMCLFVAALMISTFHLGQPLRAINTLFGAGRSPMSNEIVLAGMFCALGGIAALGMLINRGAQTAFLCLAWLAALVGLGFLAAVTRVYQLSTVATWASNYTSAIMLLTAFIGGGALAAALGARRLGIGLSLVATLISLCLRPGYIAMLMSADSALATAQLAWFSAQLILLSIGVVGGIINLRRIPLPGLVTACALVVIAGELAGRIAFYNLWAIPM